MKARKKERGERNLVEGRKGEKGSKHAMVPVSFVSGVLCLVMHYLL